MAGTFSGVSSSSAGPAYGPGGALEAPPPARRHRVPRWRSFKLIGGIVLVISALSIGGYVTSHADDTKAVWALRGALPRGTQLSHHDVIPIRVRLPNNEKTYVSTKTDIAGQTLLRDVGTKELVPADALRKRACGSLVSIPVASRHLPNSIQAGMRIDIFATLEAQVKDPSQTSKVLAGVAVQQVSRPPGGKLASSGEWSIAVRVPAAQVQNVMYTLRSRVVDIAVVPSMSGDSSDACDEPPSQQTGQQG